MSCGLYAALLCTIMVIREQGVCVYVCKIFFPVVTYRVLVAYMYNYIYMYV